MQHSSLCYLVVFLYYKTCTSLLKKNYSLDKLQLVYNLYVLKGVLKNLKATGYCTSFCTCILRLLLVFEKFSGYKKTTTRMTKEDTCDHKTLIDLYIGLRASSLSHGYLGYFIGYYYYISQLY